MRSSPTRGACIPLACVALLAVLSQSEVTAQHTTSIATTLRLPRLFQDGMVLQRATLIPVWGWASPGAAIIVDLAGHTTRANADAGGSWSAQLPALPAGGPHTLTVQAEGTTQTMRDVVIGDVWIASGQSNMEWPLAATTGGAAAVAAANDPLLREFAVPHGWSETPEADLEGGSWAAARPQQASRFSAVAYFFARDLRATQQVPIGIIHTSWGGSNIETWMSRAALGLSESEWHAIVERERAREAALRDSLRVRIGELPIADAGLLNGRALWAEPNFDDAAWATVPVPSLWEPAGYPGLDGVAWYRTTFSLTDTEARQDVRLSLGRIDDDDITWVNGIEVGRTQGYAEPRVYTVPASALRPGANVLAIRVADGGGGGGPYGEAAQFHVEVGSERRPLAGRWRFRVASVMIRPDGQRINKIPTVLYNRMLHPLQRYPIKGVIWYQGESNANNDEQARAYRPLFASMIRSWRREWSGSSREFPFLWVQLPNFGAIDTVPPVRAGWAYVRESQAAALALPRTGQVVTIDVGDARDLHPRNKEPIGQRLAQVARRIAYGEALLAAGPTYRRHTIRDGQITIDFANSGSGLESRSGRNVRGFAIAGADRRWVWADAHIEGNRVIVSSPSVPQPIAVRYAWANSPNAPALYNREGWPAAPFRTDDW
jgi:sialate O-acetylesterase